MTNALINARKAVDKSAAEEVENVPILSTSVAYGVYMAVSSNLRYVDDLAVVLCLICCCSVFHWFLYFVNLTWYLHYTPFITLRPIITILFDLYIFQYLLILESMCIA